MPESDVDKTVRWFLDNVIADEMFQKSHSRKVWLPEYLKVPIAAGMVDGPDGFFGWPNRETAISYLEDQWSWA